MLWCKDAGCSFWVEVSGCGRLEGGFVLSPVLMVLEIRFVGGSVARMLRTYGRVRVQEKMWGVWLEILLLVG